MTVIIRLSNSGGELECDALSLDDIDGEAAGEAIADAVIEIVRRTGALRVGDTITVTEESEQ